MFARFCDDAIPINYRFIAAMTEQAAIASTHNNPRLLDQNTVIQRQDRGQTNENTHDYLLIGVNRKRRDHVEI